MTKYACYYCLTVDIEPELVGKTTKCCPNCGIDAVAEYRGMEDLYARHVRGFHFGYNLSDDYDGSIEIADMPTSLLPCGHSLCKPWNEIVRKLRENDNDT